MIDVHYTNNLNGGSGTKRFYGDGDLLSHVSRWLAENPGNVIWWIEPLQSFEESAALRSLRENAIRSA